MKRLVHTLSVALLSAAVSAGCASKSTPKAEASPVVSEANSVDGSVAPDSAIGPDSVAPPETVQQAVTSIVEQPGLAKDGYVGAAKDVKLATCNLDGAAWAADGTVTNNSDSDASYRIYVAFNVKGSTDTKAVSEADIDVAKGKTEKWNVTADVADKDLQCILRVERAKK